MWTATLTHELDGGRPWPQIADWQAVVAAIVRLSRPGACEAIPLGLPPIAAALLGGGALQAEDLPSTAMYLKVNASADNDPDRDRGDLKLWQQCGHTPRVGVIQNGRYFGHNRPLGEMSE